VHIGINALQVRAAKSGVGQYIHALLEGMTAAAPDDTFTIYCTAANRGNYDLGRANLSAITWGLGEKQKAFRLLHEYAMLPSDIAARGIDVFHGASNFLPIRKVCPSVVTIHDLSYHVHPWRCPAMRRQYWYAMTRRTVALADRIIADSHNTQADIARFFPSAASRVRVVHLAAHERFRRLPYDRGQSQLPPELGNQPFILYVGTLEPGKNVQRIIEAFDAIAARHPDHLLVLAGDKGWLYNDILEAAAASPFSERIKLLGHVPDDTVVELFNFCDLFVYPSVYEGFGLPPLEAMACGAPVITSTSSSIPEVVGDAAITVAPEDTAELARQIGRVLEDKVLREDLQLSGLERAKQFSWERTAQETLAVYRELQ